MKMLPLQFDTTFLKLAKHFKNNNVTTTYNVITMQIKKTLSI